MRPTRSQLARVAAITNAAVLHLRERRHDMKKVIGFVLAGALFAVMGCGGGSSETKKETTPTPATTDAAAAAGDGGAAPAK